MTHDALRALFTPRCVAVIGASAEPRSIGARALHLLSLHGFRGRIYRVNPKYDQLQGNRVYPSVGAVPEPVDLALVIVPARAVPEVLEECAAAGVQCALIISSGFGEAGDDGRRLQAHIKQIVERTQLRVVGPNCEGIYNPSVGLCATFSPAVDPEHGFQPRGTGGPIAVISQSGGLAFALLNHIVDRGLAVGPVISTGNEVDLTWADYADYLLDDPTIRVILGFVESFRDREGLLHVARKAARLKKPVVIAKMGRTDVGRRAAASHTGSIVGSDRAYSAAFGQLGIHRVDDVDEMLDLAAYFSVGRLPTGPKVAVLTASGGAGAWVADACAANGLDLPPPDDAVQADIRTFIPPYGSVGNPVDITAQAALGGGFERALEVLVHSPGFDLVVAVSTLVREERFFETLPELRQAIDGGRSAVVFFSYTRASPHVLEALGKLGIPCFSTPARTARALGAAAKYAQFLHHYEQVAVLREDAASSADWPAIQQPMSEHQARAYLAPLGIASPPERLVTSAQQAVAAFEALGGGAVALKVQSPDLPHKSDVSGVQLGLQSASQVAAAYDSIVDAVRKAAPHTAIDGVLVQAMAPRQGIEVLLAARRDPQLGAMVTVGLGGLDVEANADVALRLAPVSPEEARSMIASLRGAGVLGGSRGRPAADVAALADAIVRVSHLAGSLPYGVQTIEINPLLVLPGPGGGVLMLDAAVELE